TAGHLLRLTAELHSRAKVALPAIVPRLEGEPVPFQVLSSLPPLRVGRDERVFDEPIQLIEVDVGQQRTDDPALRRPTLGLVPLPVFHIPRAEQPSEEAKHSVIVEISPDDVEQHIVVDVVEAAFDVPLDEPDGPCPFAVDFAQGCLTAPVWAEPVRMLRELR